MSKKRAKIKEYWWIGLFVLLAVALIFFFGTKQLYADYPRHTANQETENIIWQGINAKVTTSHFEPFSISSNYGGSEVSNSYQIVDGELRLNSHYIGGGSQNVLNFIRIELTLPEGNLTGSYKADFSISNQGYAQTGIFVYPLGIGDQYGLDGTQLWRKPDAGYNRDFEIEIKNPTPVIIEYTTYAEEGYADITGTFNFVEREEVISPPEKPQPKGFEYLINLILSFITDLFNRIFLKQAVIGPTIVGPNTEATYQVDLSTTIPDSDWSDGSYQIQYANYALVDKDGNVVEEGSWEEVFGTYQQSVTITTPANVGDYAIIALITQYDMNWNVNLGQWETGEEIILTKEAINIETKYSIIEPETPVPSGFPKFLQTIIDWLKNLWSWIFGV